MPLIEPVARCRKFNSLRREAQWFYLQLKTVLDPAGRHDAHPGILNSALFPLRKDVRDTDISRWLLESESAGLLRCYADTQGRSVVEVFDARQTRMKSIKSDFDPPEGQAPLFAETLPAEKVRKGKEEKRRERNAPAGAGAESSSSKLQVPNSEVEASVSGPPLAMVLERAQMLCVPVESARAFHKHHEDNNLWFNQFNRPINWVSKLKNWAEEDRGKSYEKHSGAHGKRVDRNAGTFNAGSGSEFASLKKKQ